MTSRAGAGLALLYVVVAMATTQLSSRPVLPLFDGFAPPSSYAWVQPPPERAADNVAPKSAEREFPLDGDGSPASSAATEDAQAIVGFDKGSVPPHPPDTAFKVRLDPADVGTLGPLPSGLRVVSNAYHVTISYLPSQTDVPELAVKGTMALTAAEPGDRLLYSPDGRDWRETRFMPFGQDNGLFTELETVGWFVVASSSARTTTHEGGGSDVLRGVLLTVLALAPIVGAVLVLRLPSPVPANARPTGRPGGSPPRSGGKKGAKKHR